MKPSVDPHSDIPPSRQLVESVLDGLARGELAVGDRLPSVRQLARDALVNPNTVVKAYRELELIGAVQGRSGSGVFVIEGAVELAQARRLTSTLEAFERAARAALRSGHESASLAAVIERLEGERDADASVDETGDREPEACGTTPAPSRAVSREPALRDRTQRKPKGTPDREEQ